MGSLWIFGFILTLVGVLMIAAGRSTEKQDRRSAVLRLLLPVGVVLILIGVFTFVLAAGCE